MATATIQLKMLRSFYGWLAELKETRYLVALVLCIANVICYADRTNIGIAVPSFVPDEGDRGVVLSAFFYGYILTQIPAGYFASRIGIKSVLALGVIVWTVFDTSTIFVADSLPLLIVVRACMGCGEGVIFPTLHRFAVNWFPVSERSTLVAVIVSGTDLGTILALFLSPWILKVTGQWRCIFLFFGTFSTIWLIIYFRYVSSKPEQHRLISQEEREFITSTRDSGSTEDKSIPWRTLLTSRYLWVIYIAHFCFNYSWYVLLGWLPTYVDDHLGLDLKENKLLAATPYICGYCGLLVWGKGSDLLIARGFRTLYVRRCMNSLSSFIPALCLYLLKFAETPAVAVFLLSISLFAGRAASSGYWINMIDVGPEYADKTMGVSNTIATIPGILGNIITGYTLKQTQNWNVVFDVAASVSIFGGVVFACFSTDMNVFTRRPDYFQVESHI